MPVNRKTATAWLIAAIAAFTLFSLLSRQRPAEQSTAVITSGNFEVWSVYDGAIESRTVRNIMSDLWNATIVDIVTDGSLAKKNDILVRFDASSWEKDLPRMEREYTMARSDLDSMINAKQPLELNDIENRLNDARQKLSEETQTRSDNHELVKEKLISEQEIKQQDIKVASANSLVKSLQQQLELTQKYLHPSAIERARATLASAQLELNHLKTQISNCVVRAPADGLVIYKIMPVGSEVRTIRVGDTVYKNQTFMSLPDMSNLVMHCDIPESDITRVRAGNKAEIQALAYPDLNFSGSIESVGAMAQSVAGRPGGRKYFSITIRVDNPDDRLRSGMSARVRVLAYSRRAAVLIPRSAVWWEASRAICNIQNGSHIVKTVIKTGLANDTHFEIIEGVKPGDRVIAR